MEGNGGRKNNDWYDDDEVLSFIKDLHGKYTPAIRKDVVIAFQEFIARFEKLELIWYEWETIYRAGRSPEEITMDILYPVRENTSISLSESLEHKRFKPHLRKNGRNHKSLMRA